MTSKFSRTAMAAAAVVGASGLVAASAQAAVTIPTHLVNAPAVTGTSHITPESATLSAVIDTGGNPLSIFSLFPGETLAWEPGNIVLSNTGTTTVSEYVDGIPNDYSHANVDEAGGYLQSLGEDNYSTVLFEYDPLSDYTANGDNPGPDTQFASEVDVPTYSGLSSVSTSIGGYPAAAAADNGETPLTPGTKYVYYVVQQPGVTDNAEDVNTFNPSSKTASTSANPSYTCYPDNYASQIAPYNGYTLTGTLAGGVTSAGGPAQTTPQPEIQGPCLYIYGGSANFYQSSVGSFTTPSLGAVTFSKTAKVTGDTATVLGTNGSVDPTSGKISLIFAGKTVATGSFSAGPHASHQVLLTLTQWGLHYIGGVKTTKTVAGTKTTTVSAVHSITAKVEYLENDDQLLGTSSITL